MPWDVAEGELLTVEVAAAAAAAAASSRIFFLAANLTSTF